jgi:NAD(P)-dependent dehydrogenase (short-subunit alcohol dehydrogenase family)
LTEANLSRDLPPLASTPLSWVDTPIWNSFATDTGDEHLSDMAARLPVGRIGRPDHIAYASRGVMDNRFTTGTVLHVDGATG